MNSYKDIWNIVFDELSKKYTDAVMELWFNNFELVYLDDEKGFITTTSDGFVDLLNKKYAPEIEKIFDDTLNFHITVKIFAKSSFRLESALSEEIKKPDIPEVDTADPEVQSEISGSAFVSEKDYTFENFIVGSSNKLAHAASVAVANHPTAYNPLFLYGASGLGKTHLMKAIANEVKRTRPDFNIIFVKGEDFTNELVRSIEKKTTSKFKEKYRNADMLLIDDIQFIAGRDSTQEEFFHTFNALHSAGKQIIISSDKPPREIARLEERLRSRFEWGLIADIQKPDFDTRIAILRKKAENEGIEISDEMLELIAGRIESNIRELEGSLTRVNAYAKLNHCEINEEVISHALHDIAVVRDPKRITPELIIDCVADYYSLSADMLRGDSRKKEIALARHVAVYLTREMTGLSLPRIGDAFGRDHSTIINSCDKVTKMLDTSSDMKSSIADLKKIITEK